MSVADDRMRLAREHHQAGRGAPAEALYRQVLADDPSRTEARVLLGTLLLQSGRIADATTLFRDDVRRKPDDAGAHVALASLLEAQGTLDEATALFERALALSPAMVVARSRLGHIARARGRLDVAIDHFHRAVALAPNAADLRNELGRTLADAGRADEAIVELRAALGIDPRRAEIAHNLGNAYALADRLDEAVGAYRQAIASNPAVAEAHNNLGGVLKRLMRLDEAEAAFGEAIRLNPNAAGAIANLAGLCEWEARHDEAVAHYRQAMAIDPASAAIHGSFLFTLLFHPGAAFEAQRAEHDAWDRRHAEPLASRLPHDNERSRDRRLRVGYVCGQFRDHVLGRYLMPLLREHDRGAVDVVCYSNNRADDAITDRFRALATEWRDVARLSDDEVATLVRADRIDVLVDTTLHMDGNRLLAFARRPAPVQVTFAGYPGSTGMRAMDWRLTDRFLDPPGAHDDRYVERSWRLPGAFWCYDALGEDEPVGGPNAGPVTFGCLNNFSKVNERVFALWADVLRAVPDSRLLLLCHEGSHRRRASEALARLGVDPRRVEFVGYRSRGDYLALYRRVDIALDTVPYNGHTTTLDALWMGVPVVTLVGDTVVGRAALSVLSNLGLTELVARTPADYTAIASALAADRTRLATLRTTLRDRIEASPLMDAPRFARGVEAAYRTMWTAWCDRA